MPPEVRPVVARHLVQFEYLLNDLSEISDEELRTRESPTIEGELLVPGLLPGQSAWISVSWLAAHARRAA